MRDELTDEAWAAIKPMLPNKPCGVEPIPRQGSRASGWRSIRFASSSQSASRLHGRTDLFFERCSFGL